MTPTSSFPPSYTDTPIEGRSAAGSNKPSSASTTPATAPPTAQQPSQPDLPQLAPTPKPKGKFARVFPSRRASAQSVEISPSTSATGSTPAVPASAQSVTVVGSSSGVTTPTTSSAPTPLKKGKFKKTWRKKGGYSLNSENDILGIVMLEIKGAQDLPKLKNSKCSQFSA